MAIKQATLNDKEQVVDMLADRKTDILLSNGKKVGVGYIIGETQDKIDDIIVWYEKKKKTLVPTNPEAVEKGEDPIYSLDDVNRLNKITRRFYAMTVAAMLLNNYWGLRLFWCIKWRLLYSFGNLSGEDYLRLVSEAKKKAQEQEFSVAMVLLMDMTTTWTTMTKKDAEEYRQELELAREAQSLKSSQH